jgi:hypothetical protein
MHLKETEVGFILLKCRSGRLLTTGTIEEKIFQRQILKQGLSGAIVDARDSTQGHFTKDELKVYFSFIYYCVF